MAPLGREQIAKMAQDCVSSFPVVVLGSGASAPYGLRGMGALADHLRDKVKPEGDAEEESWMLVRTALGQGDGLEAALLAVVPPQSLVTKVVNHTWEAIASDDLQLLEAVALRSKDLALASMIKGLFRSSHKVLNVVTTNYDRVAEYAVDQAGFLHETGFQPGIIRSRQRGVVTPYQNRNELRRVKIWKVHGSLDWFADQDGVPVCLPLSGAMTPGLNPLIVTPGTSKYEITHDEPFRTAIQGADHALENANSILCVGYGFRDRHIQAKIVERCRDANTPIVVVARTLTEEAKEFLTVHGGNKWLALEKFEGHSKAYSPSCHEGEIIENCDLGSFEGFNQMIFG